MIHRGNLTDLSESMALIHAAPVIVAPPAPSIMGQHCVVPERVGTVNLLEHTGKRCLRYDKYISSLSGPNHNITEIHSYLLCCPRSPSLLRHNDRQCLNTWLALDFHHDPEYLACIHEQLWCSKASAVATSALTHEPMDLPLHMSTPIHKLWVCKVQNNCQLGELLCKRSRCSVFEGIVVWQEEPPTTKCLL